MSVSESQLDGCVETYAHAIDHWQLIEFQQDKVIIFRRPDDLHPRGTVEYQFFESVIEAQTAIRREILREVVEFANTWRLSKATSPPARND